jgi:GTP-binding protein HflX
VNAFVEQDLLKLREAIEDRILGDVAQFRIPASRGDLAALVYRVGEVVEQETEEDWLLLTVRLNPADMEKTGRELETYRVAE